MKKQILENKLLLGIGLLGVLAVGCDDMTTTGYHNQQAQEQYARNKAAEGNYTGTLTSLDGTTQLGEFQISISASMTPVPTSDGTTMTSQAVLIGSMKILGSNPAEESFTTASYDSNTGSFSATIAVVNKAGVTQTLAFRNSTISKGKITGEIDAIQFPGNGATFTGQLNGALPSASSNSQRLARHSLISAAPYYIGTVNDPTCKTIANGAIAATGTCNVTLSINDAPTSTGDTFLDIFVRTNDVNVNVSFSDIVQDSVPHPSIEASTLSMGFGQTNSTAEFDQRNGTLICNSTSSDNSQAVTNMSCLEAPITGNSYGNFRFDCTETNNTNSKKTVFSLYPAAQPRS